MRKNNLTHLLSVLATAALVGPTIAQEPDPFVKKPATGNSPATTTELNDDQALLEIDLPHNIHLNYEVFSVPIAEAPKLCRGGFTHKSLYTALTRDAEKHSAILETFQSLIAMSGQTASSESISEFIYPTEYDPPSLPNFAIPEDEKAPELKPLAAHAVPTAYETKNLGITIEAECQIGSAPKLLPLNQKGAELLKFYRDFEAENNTEAGDPFADTPAPSKNPLLPQVAEALKKGDLKTVTYIETRISPTHVERVDNVAWGKDLSETAMPTFDVQTLKTGFTLVSSQPTLLGTMNPHPKSKKHADGKRVWFAFVTATVMKAGR